MLFKNGILTLFCIDIGVITPYRKQVQKISGLAHFLGLPKGFKVGTVENFQGQVLKSLSIIINSFLLLTFIEGT